MPDKHVEIKHNINDQMNDHKLWNILKNHYGMIPLPYFFYNANELFDFGNIPP